MKQLIIILSCLMLASCTNNKQLDTYNRFISEMDDYNQSSINIPMDINIYFEKLTDYEISYRVIIDNPKEDIKNIKAIAIHNKTTDDIYPTSGIFEIPLSLIPDDINLEDNKVKGIILIGYIDYIGDIEDFKATVKVMIEYNDISNSLEKIYYQYQK